MARTSNKAELILEFVNQFVQENGYAPSVREIGAAVGLRSTASVSYQLQQLQQKGLLLAPGGKGRKRAIVTAQRPGQFFFDVVGRNNYRNSMIHQSIYPIFPVSSSFCCSRFSIDTFCRRV